MRTILLAAAAAVALVSAGEPAAAQVRVRAGYNPMTGRMSTAGVVRNPWTGATAGRVNTHNPWTGTSTTRAGGYNPWTGTAYRGGAAVNPLTGRYGYAGYGRRW